MFPKLANRPTQYLLLTLLWAVTCLPNLGKPPLWEIDEGLNRGCSNEMRESGNWVVPHFNFELRDAKPALLYWLQATCDSYLGVNETSARMPSALAGLIAILAICELGRRLFNPAVGLLAGVILATSVAPCVAFHFANPDALLLLFVLLALVCFWHDYSSTGPWRFLLGGTFTGLAVLAKGPIGLVLPLGIIGLFLLWQRRLGWLFQLGQLRGVLTFVLTAAPWYVWVSVETKGQWLIGFWRNQHWKRITEPMEGHGGSWYLYLVVLLVGLAPWSIFLCLSVAHALRRKGNEESSSPLSPLGRGVGGEGFFRFIVSRWADRARNDKSKPKPLTPNPSPQRGEGRNGQPWPFPHLSAEVRFLLCWFLVVFVFFSLAATKLPNYILPLYPAVALLVARALDDWRLGLGRVRDWEILASLVCLGLIGVAVAVGLALVGGVGQAGFLHGRFMPAVAWTAWVGLIPLAGAILGIVLLRRSADPTSRRVYPGGLPAGINPAARQVRKEQVLMVVTLTAALFLLGAASRVVPAIGQYRAPRALVGLLPADQSFREVRVATCGYFQPSLVFYCNRRVDRFDRPDQAQEFLRGALPSYLFLPAPVWEEMQRQPASSDLGQPLGRHRDFYCKDDIVVVANQAACSLRSKSE